MKLTERIRTHDIWNRVDSYLHPLGAITLPLMFFAGINILFFRGMIDRMRAEQQARRNQP